MSSRPRGEPPGSCPPYRCDTGVRGFLLSEERQAGKVSMLMLVVILLAPLAILSAITFVLVIAYVRRVSRITAELEAKKKPAVCPACGHKLIEIRNFCAECGASIWPADMQEPQPSDVEPEGSEQP